MEADPTARLSDGQRQCLRMVLRHMSSKEIARALDISPHTVDQRLRLAMTIVGASNRIEAARRLAAAEGEAPPYQPLTYQSSPIARADRPPSLPPLQSRPEGDHEGIRKVAWIVAIVAGAAIIFAALFVGLNALSEFTR